MKRLIFVLLALSVLLTACAKTSHPNPPENTSSSGRPSLPSLPNTSSVESNNDNKNMNNKTNGNSGQDLGNGNEDSGVGFNLTGTQKMVKLPQQNEFKPHIDSPKNIINSQKGAYDNQVLVRRKEIQGTKDSDLKITGKTYYFSPTGSNDNDGLSPQTAFSGDDITAMMYLLQPGDAMLLERGGVYRPAGSIVIKFSNVTIGAYGEGDKPAIYGSLYNYAEKEWSPTVRKNIWRTPVGEPNSGNIVFNHGEAAGRMRFGIMSLMQDGDFYHNSTTGYFYLYSSKGNPSDLWQDIEISKGDTGIGGYGEYRVDNVVIDNICIKYFGKHGINFYGQNKNITIKNCELGWIGGSTQSAFIRYGNGIQFYGGGSRDLFVENNWIYQCYDSQITIQNGATDDRMLSLGGGSWENVHFRNNLCEYAAANIEIWNANDYRTGPDGNNQKTFGYFKDIYVVGNILRFSGYECSQLQRPLKNPIALTMWFMGDAFENFTIKNNVFDYSKGWQVHWLTYYFKSGYESTPGRGLDVSGNSFLMKRNNSKEVMEIGVWKNNSGSLVHYYPHNNSELIPDYQVGYYADNQAELEQAVSMFDANPKLVQFFD